MHFNLASQRVASGCKAHVQACALLVLSRGLPRQYLQQGPVTVSAITHQRELGREYSGSRNGKDEARQQSLLANAEWVRDERSTGTHDSRDGPKRSDEEIKAKLYTLMKWRAYHVSRLKVYQHTRDPSIGSKRRITQLQAVIEETTKSIRYLRSGRTAKQPEQDVKSRPTHDSNQAPCESKAPIQLKPVSLPDNLLYHLSRELLDSLNEAAFTFGQREALAMMQRNHWNTPEVIDFSVFVSSFSLYPNLVHRFVAHKKVFRRLNVFRNQYAHGSGGMTAGDVSLALDDLAAVAEILQSLELTAKVKQYRVLLTGFHARQTKQSKRAFSLVQEFQAESKAQLEKARAQGKGAQNNTEPAVEDAITQSMASQAAVIEEAWEHAEQSLLERNARKINLVVGEAQIRRIVKNLGSSANTVLSKIQEEQTSSLTDAVNNPGAEEILELLKHKLSQALVENTTEEPTKASNAPKISSNGADVETALTAELLEFLPRPRGARASEQAWQQREQLRQLAQIVRRGM